MRVPFIHSRIAALAQLVGLSFERCALSSAMPAKTMKRPVAAAQLQAATAKRPAAAVHPPSRSKTIMKRPAAAVHPPSRSKTITKRPAAPYLDGEKTDPPPVGLEHPADSSDLSPPPPMFPTPWSCKTLASDRPVVPNEYHSKPKTLLRDVAAVWWHQDTVCFLSLEKQTSENQVFTLFWDHARLGTPRWWRTGPDRKWTPSTAFSPHTVVFKTVVMRRWTGLQQWWAPANAIGEAMEFSLD